MKPSQGLIWRDGAWQVVESGVGYGNPPEPPKKPARAKKSE